jgi:phytoene synthase
MDNRVKFEGEVPPSAAKRAVGSSFYAAMRIMPPGQREAMFEIYSFCRAVDDIADDPGAPEQRLLALERWREAIDAIYRGHTPRGLVGLATAVRRFSLERADFLAVIDGMESDVKGQACAPNLLSLDLYCDRVASAVGRLSVCVFGLKHEDGIRLAHHLGRALQLTNVLRDLDEDASLGRLYLPAEFLDAAGIAARDPQEVLANSKLHVVCERIAMLARDHFAEANLLMELYPRRVVRTPRVMAEAYKAILARLLSRGWAPPRVRIRLGRSRLGLILLRHVIL